MSEQTERTDDELRRGNVIVVKGGRAMVLVPAEALELIDRLIQWAGDEKRRSVRVDVSAASTRAGDVSTKRERSDG